jgi:homoserine kinase
VTAFAPATVANLGVGFDVLGMALAAPGDHVTARIADGPAGVTIARIGAPDGVVLPIEAAGNTAGVAALAVLRKAGVEAAVELIVRKGLPVGSGMGGSAASAAAAAVAVNVLLGSPLRRNDLIGPCVEAEAAVAGRHADNVAPAVLGGIVLVRSVDPLDVVRLPVPDGLTVVVVTPRLVLETRTSRAVLPSQVPLRAFVANTANLAALVAALFANDLSLLGRCGPDAIVTPARAPLVPGCEAAIAAALAAGALMSSISGSGPSVFAMCRSARAAAAAGEAMAAAFRAAGNESIVTVSPADCPGARVVPGGGEVGPLP